MVTHIWTLQICIVIFCFKFNLKFSVTFINEQYKVFKFNIILKIYIFHLSVVMINSDYLVKLFLIRIWLVNINKCLTKKKLKMCDVYYTIFKIRKYVKYYLRLPCEQWNVYVT